jgi:putative nucleotidyltransferase with HDIG domain
VKVTPAGGVRALFDTLSKRPERTWPDAVQHHGARFLVLLALAVLTSLLFPITPAPDFPVVERGMVLARDIIAEVDFQVPKTEAELQHERDQAAAAVAPIFRYDSAAVDSMRTRVTAFLDSLDGAVRPDLTLPEIESHMRGLLAAHALPTSSDVLAMLRNRGNRTALRQSLRTTIDRDMRAGVARNSELLGSASPQVRILRGTTDLLVPREAVLTGERLRDDAARNLPANAPAGLAEFQRLVLIGMFVPTLRTDRSSTEAARMSARVAVPTVRTEVIAGERVVAAHERVDAGDLERLRAYESELRTRGRLQPGPARLLRIAGGILLNALLLAVLGVLLLLYRPTIYRSLGGMLLLAVLYLTVALPAAFIVRGSASTALIPIAFPALIAAVLWDGRMALTFALVLAALLTLQTGLGELSTRALLIAAGAAAALSVRVVHRRAHGLILGAVVAAAYAVAALGLGLLLSWSPREVMTTALWGAANGIGCALIAVGLMPVFEMWTGITTDQTLLELGDLNRPLLKRLSLEAGGTYAHSVNVAHLAEAAARAIGANPLLARVGAYYHDIGKMAAPQYFVENQTAGRNPHDRLSPEESVAIIRGHVLEGIRLAEQAKLPECVRVFIPEHHGTQLIGFFYDNARERHGDSLDPAAYAYPGPLPRSKETAILLLADSVESATKVLDNPTPERLRELVDTIVQAKINRGQLDDAPLTLRDLARISQQFVKVLNGMYHHRLDYPPSAVGGGPRSPAAVSPA